MTDVKKCDCCGDVEVKIKATISEFTKLPDVWVDEDLCTKCARDLLRMYRQYKKEAAA